MEKKVKGLSEDVKVKHSNSIIYLKNNFLDSICKLTMPERRTLWYYLRSYKYNDLSTISTDLIIKHGEYAKLFSLTHAQAAHEISSVCNTLPDNSIYQARPDWAGNVTSCLDDKFLTQDELKKLAPFQKRNLVESCSFGIRRGESEIIFTSSFLTLLIPVIGDIFTQYRILQVKGINKSTHVDLYEECKRWLNVGVYKTNPMRLINKFGLPETYLSYPQMRRGYLLPAIKAINKKTDLKIELIEVRIDKENPKSKVVKLKFLITKKEQSELKSILIND